MLKKMCLKTRYKIICTQNRGSVILYFIIIYLGNGDLKETSYLGIRFD